MAAQDPPVVGIPVDPGDLLRVAVDQPDPADHPGRGERDRDRLPGRVAGHAPGRGGVAVTHLVGLVGDQVAVEVLRRRGGGGGGERGGLGEVDRLPTPCGAVGGAGAAGRVPVRAASSSGSAAALGPPRRLGGGVVDGVAVEHPQQDEDQRDQRQGADHPEHPGRAGQRRIRLQLVDLVVGEQVELGVPLDDGARAERGGIGACTGSRGRAGPRRRSASTRPSRAAGDARAGRRPRGATESGARTSRLRVDLRRIALGSRRRRRRSRRPPAHAPRSGDVAVWGTAGAGAPIGCPQLRQNRPTPSSAPHRTQVSTGPR